MMSETLFHRTQLQFQEELLYGGKSASRCQNSFGQPKEFLAIPFWDRISNAWKKMISRISARKTEKTLAVIGSKRNILSFCVLMLKSTLLPPFGAQNVALHSFLFLLRDLWAGSLTPFHLLILTAMWWEEEKTLLSYYCRKEKKTRFFTCFLIFYGFPT